MQMPILHDGTVGRAGCSCASNSHELRCRTAVMFKWLCKFFLSVFDSNWFVQQIAIFLQYFICLFLSGFQRLALVCGGNLPGGNICKVFPAEKWMIWYNEWFCVTPKKKSISCALQMQYWLQVHLLICKIQEIPAEVRRARLHCSLM